MCGTHWHLDSVPSYPFSLLCALSGIPTILPTQVIQVSASQEAVGLQGWHYLILICPLVNVSKDFGAVLI